MAECPKCGAALDAPLEPGERCPECGTRAPERRRRRDDDDRDQSVRSPKKKGGAGKVLLIVLGVGLGSLLLCCGGGLGYYFFLMPKEVEIIDASRQKTNNGGTANVTVTLRIKATRPGNRVDGDYIFMAKAGKRTHVHRLSLTGQGGAEYRTTINTPELIGEAGSVEFWVERDDRGGTSRASRVQTIP